jgi:acyl-CoA hydrolase
VNALPGKPTEFDRAEGRTRISHIGDAGGLQPQGDIFGGWIMSLMDAAGKMSATPHAGGARCDGFRVEHHVSAASACR